MRAKPSAKRKSKQTAQSGAPRAPKKRAPRCTVCTSEKRAAIERDMVHGVSNREVARRHKLSEQVVRRHMKHIRAVVTKAKAQRKRRQQKRLLSAWERFELDMGNIDKKIAASAKQPEECQRWYLVKGRYYDIGIKLGYVEKLLPGRNGIAGNGTPDVLPPAVERMIDSVIGTARR